MEHIGNIIRKARREKGLSAEFVASKLKKPITKQAFTKNERSGNFSYETVKEIASIIGCEMDDFLTLKSTKSVHNKASKKKNCLPKTG